MVFDTSVGHKTLQVCMWRVSSTHFVQVLTLTISDILDSCAGPRGQHVLENVGEGSTSQAVRPPLLGCRSPLHTLTVSAG